MISSLNEVRFRAYVIAGSLCLAVAAHAAVPRFIPFQGKLTDTIGSPLSGTYDFVFTLYDAATLGSAVWSETQSNLPVQNGLYSAEIGKINVVPFATLDFNVDYWLEVQVKAASASSFETLSPRHRLMTSPYAFHADYANALAGQANEYWLNLTTGGYTNLHYHVGLAPAAHAATHAFGAADPLPSGGIATIQLADNAVTPVKIATGTYQHITAGNVSGVVGIANGGTNATSYTASQFLWFDGTRVAASGYANSSFAAASHAHSASDITSGTLGGARLSGDYLADVRVSSAIRANSVTNGVYTTDAYWMQLTTGGYTNLHQHSGLVPAAHGSTHAHGAADALPAGSVTGAEILDNTVTPVKLSTGTYPHVTAGGISGVVGIANGGTNATSYTASQFLWFDGTRVAASGYANSSFAAASHAHSASDITSGTLGGARLSGSYLSDVRVSSAIYASTALSALSVTNGVYTTDAYWMQLTTGGYTNLHQHSGLVPAAHGSTHAHGAADALPAGSVTGAEILDNTVTPVKLSTGTYPHVIAGGISGVVGIANGGTNAVMFSGTRQFLWYAGSSIAASGYTETSFAATSHAHNASDINSGTLPGARLTGDYLADVRVSSAIRAGSLAQGDYQLTASTAAFYRVDAASLTATSVTAVKYYGDGSALSGLPGGGDMLKSTYDTDGNNIADDAQALSGYAYAHFMTTSTAQTVSGNKSFSGTVNPDRDLDVGGAGSGVRFSSSVRVGGILTGTTAYFNWIALPAGLVVLIYDNENDGTDVNFTTSEQDSSTHTLTANSFSTIIVESEVYTYNLVDDDNRPEITIRIRIGSNVEAFTYRNIGNSSNPANSGGKVNATLKYSAPLPAGGAIRVTIQPNTFNGNIGGQAKSLRVYGVMQ